jgi:large repetitive protein
MNHSLHYNIKLLFLLFSLLFGSYQVNAKHHPHRVNDVGPVVTGVSVPVAREYKTGDILTFDVNFSEVVITNPIGVTPYLPVKIGSKQLMIPMYAGVGLSNMVFQYTIEPGDQDLDGIEVGSALTISSGTIQNAAGQAAVMTLNNVTDTRGVLVNSSYPTVDLSGPSASVINAPFKVLVVFSDFVSGLTASDFTVVNATVSEPETTDSVNYFIDVTPITDGPLSIFLPANAAVNKGPNGNQASNQIDVTADLTAPTITRLDIPAAGKYGTTSTLDFTVHFSENVTVRTTNGTPTLALTIGGKVVVADFSAWVGNDALAFSYKIQDGDMDMDGIALGASLLLNGASIRDAGRNNAKLTLPGGIDPSGIIVNTVRPTAVLSTTAPALVNNPFTVTLVFSEPVTGVTESSFQTTNLNFDAISTTDNIHYTLAVAANYNGPVKISLPQDGALNPYSSGNTASNEISLMADYTSPKITKLTLPANGTYNTTGVLNFTVEYNEVVYVTTTGGTPNIPVTIGTKAVKALCVSGSGTNTLVYSYAIKEGEKDLDGITLGRDIMWGGGRVQDLAGNDALTRLPANSPVGILVNTTRPTVVLSTTAPAVLKDPFQVTVVFSEVVSGLTAFDFALTNANVTTPQTTDNITYTVWITPSGDGAVSVSLPADAAENALLNGNTVSNQLSVTADLTPPVVTLVGVPADGYYNASGTLSFTVEYGEQVFVTTTNGTPTLPVNIGGTTVQAQYSGGSGTPQLTFVYAVQNGDADADGIAVGTTLSLNGATIKDAVGNDAGLALHNIATTSGVFVNTTHPAVTLSTTAPAVLNNPFTVTAVFSEAVTGFSVAGLHLVNANAGIPQTTDNITYTIEITPMTNGAVSVSVAADAAVNVGQNGNTASNQIDVTADFRQPKITRVDIPADGYYNATQTLSFTVHFDETVMVDATAGLPLMAVSMDAATVPVEYVSGSGTDALKFRYVIQDGDIDVDGIYISPAISLGAGATIRDAAGNNVNLIFPAALDGSGIFVNTTHPDVVLSTTAGAVVSTSFTVKAVFTEAVTGVAVTDFTATNATVSNLQTTDNITYTVSITPIADGAVTVLIPANTAVNIGRNGNTESNTISVTADNTVPVITQVDVPANGYYKAGSTLTFVLKYSEPVVVNTTAGKPAIGINMGGITVPVVYTSGSGTSLLTFSYIVKSGDMDMDGILLYNGMVMNGGTIKDVAGNDASAILNNIAATNSIFVNTAHPSVVLTTSAVSPVNAPFTVTAVFSEAVTDLTAGDFLLTNASGSTLQTTDNISYTLYITPTADGAVGVSLPADAAVNIGNNGNTASNLISVTADINAPVVTQVIVPTNGYYKSGDALNFTVKYSENVTVSGTPAIPVNIGGANVSALYTGGSGTQLLSFSYTVQNGDLDMDGITLGASLSLNGATIRDAANNNASLTLNNIGNTSNIFVNTVHPTVILSTTATTSVNAPFTVNVVFSEAVTGLTAGDFSLVNATAATLQTTDNITYSIVITPGADGPVSISLPADAAVNIGGNGNTASNIINITADMTAPVVTQVSVPTNGYYKAGSTLNFTVKYSESVTVSGTPAIPVNIGGTNVSALYTGGSGTQLLSFSYTVQNGDLDMDGITLGNNLLLNSGTIQDAANNNASLILNNIGNTSSVFVNTIHPTVMLSTAAAGIVNAPFTVNVVFSEAVTGLTAGDFSLVNATAATLQTTDNITYSIVITPVADGPVSVSLPADAAVNIGGNGNTVSNTINITADVTAPVVTEVIVPTSGYYKAGSTLNFTVKYSENVTVSGTPAIPVNIGGANVSALYTGGSGTQLLSFSYTVQNGDLDMDGITLGSNLLLNSATIQDAANNNASLTLNNIGNTSNVFVNTVHPTVTLSTAAAAMVNAPFTVNVVFSEAVTGLTVGDFSLVNATAATLQTIDNITYSIVITPVADGPVSVSLPADAAVNIGGNGNTASNIINITADMTAPVVTQVSVPVSGYYKAGSTLNFTVKYSENVTVSGTPAIPVNIGGTNVSAVYTGGSGTQLLSFSYTVQNGDLDMDGIMLGNNLLLNSGTIRDAANNNAALTLNNIGNTSNVFVNTVHPTVTLSTAAAAMVNAPFTVNVVFSEAVTGLSVGDFSLVNATAATLQTTDNITYSIVMTPVADGPVSISLPTDAALNIGGNGNTASNIINITADITAPVVTQVSVPVSGYYKAGSTLNFTVKYSENVTVSGTPAIPVNIGGTNVSAVYTGGSGTQLLSFSYTVQNGDLDMDGITLGNNLLLNSATIRDAANNNAALTLNNIGNTSNVFVNTLHPTVMLSTAAAAMVNAPFTVNVVFSEAVTGLTAGDFSLVNATAATLQTTDNITYSIVITPVADGPVSVSLPADAALNIGGNGNTASNTINITADMTAPVVTQVSVPVSGYYKAGSTLNFTVKYSENVTVSGTPAIPVNIGGTNVLAVYTGGSGTQLLSFSYTVQNGDLDMDGIMLGNNLLLNSGTIRDAANNNASLTLNNIGNTNNVFVNTVHPTVMLSTAAAGIVNAPFTVNVVFSEMVTGLSAGDFSLTNANAAMLQTTDNITYTIEITPAADGAVGISLPADAAVNIGGNGNTAANTLTLTADLTAPVITAGQAFSVNEHSPVGTIAGTLTATETRGTLQRWTITTDGSGGAFAIDATTGVINVKDKAILDSKVNTTVTLSVTVSDGLNTSAPETVSINVVPVSLPPTDINIDNNIINERSPAGTLVGTLSAVSTDPAATFTYSLVTGTGSTDNSSFRIVGNQLQTAAVLNNGSMSIRVQATSNQGLSVEKVLNIQVKPVNQAPVLDAINDQRVCNNGEVQTLQLTGASPVEAGQTLTYTIAADQPYFNTLTVSNTGLIAYSIKTGVSGPVKVTVTVKDNGGTANGGVDFLQRTFTITVNSIPAVTISSDKGNTIAKGAVIQLTASGGDTYNWTNADGIISGQQTAVLKVKQAATTTYQVTATNGNGCSNTATITITVTEGIKLEAGNILTPNGDGKNDRWVVNNLALYPDNEVTIYDRAGRVVYHRKNYSNDWDGTVNGNPLGEGTYYYILVIKDTNTTVKGFISIIRDK